MKTKAQDFQQYNTNYNMIQDPGSMLTLMWQHVLYYNSGGSRIPRREVLPLEKGAKTNGIVCS